MFSMANVKLEQFVPKRGKVVVDFEALLEKKFFSTCV